MFTEGTRNFLKTIGTEPELYSQYRLEHISFIVECYYKYMQEHGQWDKQINNKKNHIDGFCVHEIDK